MTEEVELSDGVPSVAGSILIDSRVHRRTGPWTPSVHALLLHLESQGFDRAARVAGFDDLGREVLTWVQGLAPTMPWPAWMRTDDALGGLVHLLSATTARCRVAQDPGVRVDAGVRKR